MRGPKWDQIASFVDGYMDRKYGRLMQQFFSAKIASVASTGSGYTVTIIRNGETVSDGASYAVAPNYVPKVGDVVECAWRDQANAYVLWPLTVAGSGLFPQLAAVKIGEFLLSTAQSSVTFSAIPQIYRHLECQWQARSDTAAEEVDVQFNGDTTTNYDFVQDSNSAGSARSWSAITTTTHLRVGIIGTTGGGQNNGGFFKVINYANSVWRKNVISSCFRNDTGAYTDEQMGGEWDSTAAITSMRIFAGAGNFTANSIFTLYAYP